MSVRDKVIAIVFILLFLFLVGYQVFLGFVPPSLTIREEGFRVGNFFYNRTVDHDDIESITLVERSMREIGVGTRVGGLSVSDIRQGNFTSGFLLVNADVSPTIRIVREGESNIYISLADSESTKEFYNEIIGLR